MLVSTPYTIALSANTPDSRLMKPNWSAGPMNVSRPPLQHMSGARVPYQEPKAGKGAST